MTTTRTPLAEDHSEQTAAATVGERSWTQAVAAVLPTFVLTRAAIWLAAAFAFLTISANPDPDAFPEDDPRLPDDVGFATEIWARFDSVPFLHIARDGYDSDPGAPAFYPLYPALVAGLGRAFLGNYILAGIVVSLASFLAALVLLRMLATRYLGEDGARRAVLYAAVFPMALLFQAVYSESLFLALSLGAFLVAERGRFAGAGALAGLAWLTRPFGVALLPALVLLALRAPVRWRALLSLGLAPLLFAVYPFVLWLDVGDPWAFGRVESGWGRELSSLGPLGGVVDGLRAGWAGVLQLTVGSDENWYWTPFEPARAAAVNLTVLAFLALFIVLAAAAWRLLGSVYGLYAVASLAIPLSFPTDGQPLLSLPRFGLVVFPFFLVLAAAGRRRRVHDAILVVSIVGLGVAVVQWATRQSGLW